MDKKDVSRATVDVEAAVKKNGIVTFVWKWMDLEISMLSEITRLRKTNTTCFLSCVELDLK